MNLNDYYSQLTLAQNQLETLYTSIHTAANAEEEPDLAKASWSDALWRIQRSMNHLDILQAIHHYERITKPQMVELFKRFSAGDGSGKIIVGFPHAFTVLDTPRSLERKYGVSYQAILDFNGLTSDELLSTEPGQPIQIPVPVSIAKRTTDIPVFGDQSGDNILGIDLPNELVAGEATADGIDLEPLLARDSFVQSIQNMSISVYGSLPFYESFGLDLVIGEDIPSEAVDSVTQLKVANGLLSDPRVKEVEILTITRINTALTVEVQIQPVHGDDIIIPLGKPVSVPAPGDKSFTTAAQ